MIMQTEYVQLLAKRFNINLCSQNDKPRKKKKTQELFMRNISCVSFFFLPLLLFNLL